MYLGFIAEAEKLSEAVTAAKNAANDAKNAVKAQKDALSANNREINSLSSKCEKLQKANTAKDLEVQQLTHTINKVC